MEPSVFGRRPRRGHIGVNHKEEAKLKADRNITLAHVTYCDTAVAI